MLKPRAVVRILVGALLLLLALVAFTVVERSNQRITPSVAVPAEQVPRVIAAADSGDAGAAARLSKHYLQVRDYRNSWIRMEQAKRLGHPGADSDLTELRKLLPSDAITGDLDATQHP